MRLFIVPALFAAIVVGVCGYRVLHFYAALRKW